MTTTESKFQLNGIDLEATLGARDALTEAPAAAAFTWKATSEWVDGTHTRTSFEDFFGLGADQSHRQTYSLDTDHPEVFAAQDNGITPVEMLLSGLAGCLTGGIASVAANRGVQLHSVRATVTGDMDLRGILGIDPEVRNGYDSIQVTYEIEADASREEIEGIVAQSQKRSAVFDALANPTTIEVTVA